MLREILSLWRVIIINMIWLVGNIYSLSEIEILKKADIWRAPNSSFETKIHIVSYENNSKIEEIELIAYVRDFTSTLVEFTAPSSWKGKKMLMLKNDMWMIFPNASRPVRITPAQRLMGEIANGDIARMNFAEDYNIISFREEKIDNEELFFLELVAKTKEGTTYYKIHYWVNRKNFMPIKAEFFSLSGRKLKRCHYLEPTQLGGGQRISKVIIYDAVKTSKYSIMQYLHMKEREIPSLYYNLNYLLKK